MTSSTGEFRHERLNLSGEFMRLLQIQGGTKKDMISLRITQYAMHRRPSYAAISYTWGSHGSETRLIRVNGRPFRIRVNLWNLLYHLRQRGESRFLWVDALCIDQANVEERNVHVQFMAKIYRICERAIVWLGLPSEDLRQARVMEFIGEMAAVRRRGASAAQFREMYLSERYASRWATLLELCRGNYWTRTWIIQEFVQASNLEVLCGTASLDWKDFEVVVQTVREISAAASSIPAGLAAPGPGPPAFLQKFKQTIPFRLTSRRIGHTASTLEELLSEFYDSKCAERRDKIYGILGIAEDCGDDPDTGLFRGPRPDYSKHILEVFFEVFDYLRPSATRGTLPLQAVFLAQRALAITQGDVKSYIALLEASGEDAASLDVRLKELSCPLVPDYVNVIDEVLPGWTSIRDLRQRLEQVDWAKYVGHEVKRKPLLRPATSSSSRKSSFTSGTMVKPALTASPSPSPSPSPGGSRQTSYVRAPLPVDLLENVLHAASHSEEIVRLYNYPSSVGCMIPTDHILLHDEDKRLANNPSLLKPSVVIESNPSSGVDPVRVGFACTDAQRGDLICQFHGVETTLVARRVGGGAAGGLRVVGTARMVGHTELKEKGCHPGCRGEGPGGGKGAWSGVVVHPGEGVEGAGVVDANAHANPNRDDWHMVTDPVSLWEVVRRG